MYIEPNTTVKFLFGVPLDNSYENTINWDNNGTQEKYFSSKARYTLDRQSYQRITAGKMKVELPVERLYNCNYMMFRNDNFENKWFYAFVLNVEYVSNTVCSVTYVIDVMQTWFFDYQAAMCFVERETPSSDNIGEYRLDEGFACNLYITNESNLVGTTKNYYVVASQTPDGGSVSPYVNDNGVLIGLYVYGSGNANDVANKMKEFNENGYGDAIVNAYIGPVATTDMETEAPSRTGTLDGYRPRNNKLYTYPYTRILCVSPSGNKQAYSYENFNNGVGKFKVKMVNYPNPAWLLFPLGYCGKNSIEDGLPDNTCVQIACAGDSYKAWLAQTTSAGTAVKIGEKVDNTVTNFAAKLGFSESTSSIIGDIAGKVSKYITPAISAVGNALIGGFGSLSDAIGNLVSGGIRADMKPDSVLGSAAGSTMTVEAGTWGLYKVNKETINAEYARTIDDYFTRFGYKVNRTKYPSRNSRPHWTYTKTVGFSFQWSYVPADSEDLIKKIYDKGITFWNNPDEIGDYSLDNSPR